jgi:ribosomal-protein-alanine N-acetyltransferase
MDNLQQIHFPEIIPRFETERLILKKLTENDLPALLKLRGDILAMRYLDRPMTYTLQDAKDLMERSDKMEIEKTGFQLGIFLKENEEMIGTIGFFRMDYSNLKTEIGYMIMPPFWRMGLGTEALKPIIQFGFEEMRFHRIEADINPENDASIALTAKLGFKKEAHLRQNFRFEGRFTDTIIMGLLKEDWTN